MTYENIYIMQKISSEYLFWVFATCFWGQVFSALLIFYVFDVYKVC